MDEDFELPVNYKGKELIFPAQFLRSGYSYKIQVDVNGQLILFEPDEERAWRALADADTIDKKKTDPELLHAIVQTLDELLK